MEPITRQVNTLHLDYDKEFAQHESTAKVLDPDFYFSRAYASWYRNLNKNTYDSFDKTSHNLRFHTQLIKKIQKLCPN